jgi:hypothetical protein
MTILFRPQGAFGWFSYTTSRDTIVLPTKICPGRQLHPPPTVRCRPIAAGDERQCSARIEHLVRVADIVQTLLKGYTDLFEPGGKGWPTFVCASVV